ncbi:adenylate cyclase type 2-like protein [Cricetulus griseus]|nr:adenylate cyclase type 2-like protein [Cricetulus griseus]
MSQQHPLIVFLLLIVMGACLALLAVFFALGLEVEDHVAFLITVPTALAIFFAIFILVCIESVFKKLLRVFSVVIWICLVAMGYLFMCFGGTVSAWDQLCHTLLTLSCGQRYEKQRHFKESAHSKNLAHLPEAKGVSPDASSFTRTPVTLELDPLSDLIFIQRNPYH